MKWGNMHKNNRVKIFLEYLSSEFGIPGIKSSIRYRILAKDLLENKEIVKLVKLYDREFTRRLLLKENNTQGNFARDELDRNLKFYFGDKIAIDNFENIISPISNIASLIASVKHQIDINKDKENLRKDVYMRLFNALRKSLENNFKKNNDKGMKITNKDHFNFLTKKIRSFFDKKGFVFKQALAKQVDEDNSKGKRVIPVGYKSKKVDFYTKINEFIEEIHLLIIENNITYKDISYWFQISENNTLFILRKSLEKDRVINLFDDSHFLNKRSIIETGSGEITKNACERAVAALKQVIEYDTHLEEEGNVKIINKGYGGDRITIEEIKSELNKIISDESLKYMVFYIGIAMSESKTLILIQKDTKYE